MKKNILYNIFFFIIILIIIEILLTFFGKNIQINSESPIFISKHYRSIDETINNTGYIDSQGFRTHKKTISGSLFLDLLLFNQNKNKNECSIVIMGDSFVWGDGILPGKTWPDIFSTRTKCKVFSFGKNGWSSLDIFNYHDKYLKDINYDFLIISIVHNDMDLNERYENFNFNNATQQIYFINLFPKWYQRIHSYIIKKSDVYYFLNQGINQIIQKNVKSQGDINNLPIQSWGYFNWINRLHQHDVIDTWYKIIEKFNNNNKDYKNILYFFTVNAISEIEDYDKFKNYFDQKKFNYLYCRQERINIGNIKRNDWANLANGHPGTKQINDFADCLENYFKKINF